MPYAFGYALCQRLCLRPTSPMLPTLGMHYDDLLGTTVGLRAKSRAPNYEKSQCQNIMMTYYQVPDPLISNTCSSLISKTMPQTKVIDVGGGQSYLSFYALPQTKVTNVVGMPQGLGIQKGSQSSQSFLKVLPMFPTLKGGGEVLLSGPFQSFVEKSDSMFFFNFDKEKRPKKNNLKFSFQC